MNKTYPVVLYPKVILKFLARNPTPTLASYQQKKQNSSSKTASQRAVQPRSQVMPKKWKWLLLFGAVLFMALAFAYLSPFWLVAAAWGLILLGIMCYSTANSTSKKTPTERAVTTSTDNSQTEIVLCSPERDRLLASLLSGSVMPSEGISRAQQGVSEKGFQAVLQQIFPSVVQGLEFRNSEQTHPYSADFALIHKNGLSIDIEIDEPYVGNTKEPHHCIDQGKDDIRNEFFTAGNWMVVRFSEKQVVLYPQSCCKVIANLVARVSGDYTYAVQLQGVPDLPPDPMWKVRQANKWAKEDYRSTYLNYRNLHNYETPKRFTKFV